MVSKEDKLIYNIKLSSVGPGYAAGSNVVHEPSGMDLAMKLHYFIGVYLFRKEASLGLTTSAIKESIFYWLNHYHVTCGRFRRPDSGRPYMKCNDCGARFIEAQCDKTVDEWLEMRDYSLNKKLVYHLPIGPELSLSPPVYLQLTWFKCGGMSLGLSWAHVLGDAFSACDFVNMWGQVVSHINAHGPPSIPRPPSAPTVPISKPETQPAHTKPKYPLSIKRVDPVGDHWVPANKLEMETFTFQLTGKQIKELQCKYNQVHALPVFESLCAVIWKCVANILDNKEGANTMTLCKTDPESRKTGKLSNNQFIRTIVANFEVGNAGLEELGRLVGDEAEEGEWREIQGAVEKDNGASDFLVYGANLTFVSLEGAHVYGLQLNGNKPDLVWYGIEGVGDKGAVLVMNDATANGRLITLIFPQHHLLKLKSHLITAGLLLPTTL